ATERGERSRAATRIPPVIVLECRLEHMLGLRREHSSRSLIRDRERELERRPCRTRPFERRPEVVQLCLDKSDVGRHPLSQEDLDARRITEEEPRVPPV